MYKYFTNDMNVDGADRERAPSNFLKLRLGFCLMQSFSRIRFMVGGVREGGWGF